MQYDKCTIYNCKRNTFFRRWCKKHYELWIKRGNICYVKGCSKPGSSRGLCRDHFYFFSVRGDPLVRAKAPNGQGFRKPGYYVQLRINGTRKLEHQIVAEAVLGRPLPEGAAIHHVDGDKCNNAKNNLVICPSLAYHNLLHRRARALEECGNANWHKCSFCKKYDDSCNLKSNGSEKNEMWYHKICRSQYRSGLKSKGISC